jgi:hypothetical protein
MTEFETPAGHLTRRGLIGAGAATAAAGAALYAPEWSWGGRQSVAGKGGRKPPWKVWDKEADPVVAKILERGQVAKVNEILRSWKKNGQALPKGLPRYVRDFIEEARELPEWTDRDALIEAVEFNKKRGTYLGIAYGFVSGMMSTVIPHEARAVYYSKGGANMKRRISRTAKYGYDIGSLGAFHRPEGEMIVTSVKTRMAHAGVRYWLPKSRHWKRAADEAKPISQRDILVTWHSLPTSVMRSMEKWGVQMTSRESDAFLHSWQVAASMLGVRDQYIPKTWNAAYKQAPQVLDSVLEPTPEGIELAHILLNLAADADGGLITTSLLESMTRYFLGDEIAEWLQIPRNPGQDEMLAASWPQYVLAKETSLNVPGSEELWWFFDEILRQGTLYFLAEGEELNIEIPDMNNPNHPA